MIRICEMVMPGHPDKFSDQIADAIVAECLRVDPDAYCQVEVGVWSDQVWLSGGTCTRKPLVKTALLAGAAWSALSTFAMAQDAAPQNGVSALDDVVVSARRRDELLKDVPISVSAIGEERLEQTGASDITALQQQTPNATVQVARGSNSTLIAFIRGVGQQDPLWGFEPGVGLYVDDVYVARPQGAVLDIYDVQRIEVLRGPQGSLYGRNTVGGAIKYVTNTLSSDPELTLRGAFGSYNQIDLMAVGSIPLAEKQFFVVTLSFDSRDEFMFMTLVDYMNELPALRSINNFTVRAVRSTSDYTSLEEELRQGGHPQAYLSPGEVFHIFRLDKRWLWMKREVQVSTSVVERIALSTLGRDKTVLERFVEEALQARTQREVNKVSVFIPSPYTGGDWMRTRLGNSRKLGSVILKAGQSETILGDLQRFFASQERYIDLGIPWRVSRRCAGWTVRRQSS